MSGDEEGPKLTDHIVGPWREPPGVDLSRILALSDGVFAFAMTLLVVNLTDLGRILSCGTSCSDSELAAALAGDWQLFIGYATVFLIIAIYWTTHHRIFRYIERYDTALIWLNIFFLLTIAFTPFVLELYNTYPDLTVAVAFSSAVMATTGLLSGAMWFHATGNARLVDPKLGRNVVEFYRTRAFAIPAVFLIAIPVAFVVPSYASFCWLAALPASILVRRYGGS